MNKFFSSVKKIFDRKQFKYGGYALIMTIVGIAVIVLINVGLTVLDENYNLKIDTTQNKTYTLTEQTKKLAASLTKDIFVYTTYSSGKEDKDIVEILDKIKALSPRIHVENKDTVKDPTFSSAFTKNGQIVSAGDIIVSDADNKLFKILGTYAQYSYDYDSSTGQSTKTQIKVEGSMVTAMNYINLGYMPAVFAVQGHGELGTSDLSEISAYMSDQNYDFQTVNIAQEPGKVKAGDVIMFFNPQKDISEAERATLTPLIEKGGRFFFLLDPLTTNLDTMPNLAALLKQFDISLKKGIVVEGDSSHYATPTYPMILVPEIQSHTITDQMTNKNIPMYIPVSGALQLPEVAPDSATKITSLLKTSDKAFIKDVDPNDEKATYDQLPTDEAGIFDLAAAVEKTVGTEATDSVKMVIAYNTAFVTNSNITSSSNNMSFFMYCTAWMRNAEKDIVVVPKVLSAAYFNVSSTAQFWTITVIAVALVPVLMVAAAIFVYTKRKHL